METQIWSRAFDEHVTRWKSVDAILGTQSTGSKTIKFIAASRTIMHAFGAFYEEMIKEVHENQQTKKDEFEKSKR